MTEKPAPEVPTPARLPDPKPGAAEERILKHLEPLFAAEELEVDDFAKRIASDMVLTTIRLIRDGADGGQLKLINSALKEMRYAYRVFNRFRGRRKISIFGSARTPVDHPDYDAARRFSALMAESSWMSITGAGLGIMQAGHEGPKREHSFGLSIRLPFETTANTIIEGDPKLINFRYFFTRKLMFMSHADAVAVFPGGFGTMDELFEALTLIQTGKNNIVPVVLVEGEGGHYWKDWLGYIQTHLLGNGWISPEDPHLFHVATTVEDAAEHVLRFYRRYHSSRYVREKLVLRLLEPLSAAQIATLNDRFAVLLETGSIEQGGAFPEEDDHLELPRLHFHHNRHHFATVRAMIDAINEM